MKFKTQYDEKRERVFTNPGNPMKDVYKMRLNEKGQQVLEKVSQYSLFDEIQSHLEETEIHALVERYQLTGDPSVLMKQPGQYGDFTALPTSLADVYRFVADANNFFEDLPVEVRREYNFSASEFFADIGSEKSQAIFKKYKLDGSSVPSVLDMSNSNDTAATIEMLQNQISDAQAQIAELEGANNGE